MRALILTAALLLTLASPAAAVGFYRGNSLHENCQGTEFYGICGGYVTGILDLYRLENPGSLCIPEEVESGQLVDVATKYLADHPAIRQNAAATLVMMAFKEAFGCPAVSP